MTTTTIIDRILAEERAYDAKRAADKAKADAVKAKTKKQCKKFHLSLIMVLAGIIACVAFILMCVFMGRFGADSWQGFVALFVCLICVGIAGYIYSTCH
jgi:uncharacterized protein YqhQ